MEEDFALTVDIDLFFNFVTLYLRHWGWGTRQGEAIVIVVRFVNDDWCIVRRLIRIDVCAKSVKGDELAQVLKECLSVDYGVRAD